MSHETPDGVIGNDQGRASDGCEELAQPGNGSRSLDVGLMTELMGLFAGMRNSLTSLSMWPDGRHSRFRIPEPRYVESNAPVASRVMVTVSK